MLVIKKYITSKKTLIATIGFRWYSSFSSLYDCSLFLVRSKTISTCYDFCNEIKHSKMPRFDTINFVLNLLRNVRLLSCRFTTKSNTPIFVAKLATCHEFSTKCFVVKCYKNRHRLFLVFLYFFYDLNFVAMYFNYF